jgi:8-oxo-dGTP pyrophosphatase MutT (NUDIX family)
LKQIGALPLILKANGEVEICLITSRGGKRWIIPKGNPMRGVAPHDVAAIEAREEAGVVGVAHARSIGMFTLRGRKKKRKVVVYPLIVDRQLLVWDEVHERKWQRCNLKTACRLVGSRSLAVLLRGLQKGSLGDIRRFATAQET